VPVDEKTLIVVAPIVVAVGIDPESLIVLQIFVLGMNRSP